MQRKENINCRICSLVGLKTCQMKSPEHNYNLTVMHDVLVYFRCLNKNISYYTTYRSHLVTMPRVFFLSVNAASVAVKVPFLENKECNYEKTSHDECMLITHVLNLQQFLLQCWPASERVSPPRRCWGSGRCEPPVLHNKSPAPANTQCCKNT